MIQIFGGFLLCIVYWLPKQNTKKQYLNILFKNTFSFIFVNNGTRLRQNPEGKPYSNV
jgi:hypothetical protein